MFRAGMKKGKTPLHGTVLLCLEMIVWSVASAVPQRAVKTIKRINDFHRGLKTGKKEWLIWAETGSSTGLF